MLFIHHQVKCVDSKTTMNMTFCGNIKISANSSQEILFSKEYKAALKISSLSQLNGNNGEGNS